MRHSTMFLVRAATLALLVGCGSDGGVTTPAGLEGEYVLASVNGADLPFLKGEFAAERVEVVSGSLTLRSNRTYSGEIVEQRTIGANTTFWPETSAGTFTVSGNQLTFRENGTGAVYHGAINGNRISATLIDVTFEFVGT